MTVRVYGASDDFIEVEGDLREEFGAFDTAKVLTFSDGTQLRVEYSPEGYEGRWQIVAKFTPAADDEDNYSDVVEFETTATWVECWDEGGPSSEELANELNDWDDWHSLGPKTLLQVYRLVTGHV